MEHIAELEGDALAALLSADGAQWLEAAQARLASGTKLEVLFPAIARSVGRSAFPGGRIEHGEILFDRLAWRACDAVGRTLLCSAGPADDVLVDLFLHGDFEERSIVLRCHTSFAVRPSTVELLGEVQRSNTDTHFEALVCDSNLLARAMRDEAFDIESGYKILLKAAFIGLPLDRFHGVLEHASTALSEYVLGLATEREAAGRAIWPDTVRVLAHAPIPGTRERVMRGLTQSEPALRAAAARAALVLASRGEDIADFGTAAAEAAIHEHDPALRAQLEAVSSRAESKS